MELLNIKARRNEMIENSNALQEINSIASAIHDKSKRTFKYQKKNLKNQAMSFSPIYRDFILKIINNKSLKIKHSYRDSFIKADFVNRDDFKKKGSNQIVADISDTDNLAHELGHSLDFYFGRNNALTTSVILSNGQTFHQIVKDEFEQMRIEMHEYVTDNFRGIVDSHLGEGSFNLLDCYMDVYRGLYKHSDEKTRTKIHKELYKSGFVETYYQYVTKGMPAILDDKYHPIIDLLSSKYDFSGFRLSHHDEEYYYLKSRLGFELFANLFSAKVTSRYDMLENFEKMMPRSMEAFEELFSIIYDHIQNDKRFTDLELKEAKV